MSETWTIQKSIKGLDSVGREVMINIRADTAEQYGALMKVIGGEVNALKALPVRTYGGKAEKKAIIPLPGSPVCPTHNQPMNPKEWTNQQGQKFVFWSCGHTGPDGYCKAKVDGRPTPEQLAEWKKLNGIEDAPTTGNGNGAAASGNGAKPDSKPTEQVELPTDAKSFAAWQKANGVAGQLIHDTVGSVPDYFKANPGKTYTDLAKVLLAAKVKA